MNTAIKRTEAAAATVELKTVRALGVEHSGNDEAGHITTELVTP